MTIFVQDIITRAVDTLQDAGSVRWPAAELIRYVNDGVRALVITRPDTSVKKVSLTPVAGARQSMPDDAVSLVDIIGNTSGRQRSVSRVDMTALSMVDPEWQNATASATPSHFMFDERDPYFYYLYRPSTGTGSIDMLYSFFPADVTVAGDGIGIHRQWSAAVLNYVLSRAYDKDSEFGGNATLSAMYLARFNADMDVQARATSAATASS